ncbi:MAG: S-layer homology domain-containing protein, partial [Syntrophomonas sp.]
MKSQRVASLFCFCILTAAFLTFVSAYTYADGVKYEREAQTLNDLGLYKGISVENFNPDLGSALNRETGIVMLIRLFGLETAAASITNADEILSKFGDAGKISGWAKNAVAYAVQNGLVVGYPDGTVGAKQPLNGKDYCSLILRQLGYAPNYFQAPAELAAKGGISPDKIQLYSNKDLIKDDLVGISYGCLKADDTEGTSVLENLVALGVVDNTRVETIISNLPDLRPALTVPILTPSVPPTPTVSPSGSGHS